MCKYINVCLLQILFPNCQPYTHFLRLHSLRRDCSAKTYWKKKRKATTKLFHSTKHNHCYKLCHLHLRYIGQLYYFCRNLSVIAFIEELQWSSLKKMEIFFFLFCIFLYSTHRQYVFSKLHFILWQFMGGIKPFFLPNFHLQTI